MKWILGLVLGILALAGWFLLVRVPPAEPGSGRSADAFCLDLLARKTHREAMSWVSESKAGEVRTIGEPSPAASAAIVKRLYDDGARQVWAVDLEIYPNQGQSTNTLILELPQDPKLRTKLFRLEARAAASGGFDPVSDDVQRYMFLYKFKLPFHW